jgi:transposase
VHRHELTDAQWDVVSKLLPRGGRGRPGDDDRSFINAVLWLAKTGAPWRDLPSRYGSWKTVYNRFSNWARREVWLHVFKALALSDDEIGSLLDASVVRAHQDAAGGKGGPQPTRSAARAAGSRRRSMR